jgi:hypothetical protein
MFKSNNGSNTAKKLWKIPPKQFTSSLQLTILRYVGVSPQGCNPVKVKQSGGVEKKMVASFFQNLDASLLLLGE